MDGLRGVAMLFVFLGHFCAVWTQQVHPKGAAGLFLRIVDADATFGSSLFMLLSTFFAFSSFRRGGKPFGTFLRRRLLRIYPLYLVMTAVYIVGSLVFPSLSKLPDAPASAALYLLANLTFLPGVFPIRPLMDVAWTLSFVLLFYFVSWGLAALLKGRAISRFKLCAAFFLTAIVWAQVGELSLWWEPRTAILWAGIAMAELISAMSERTAQASRFVPAAAFLAVLGVWGRTYLMMTGPETPFFSLLVWRAIITTITLSAFCWTCYFGPNWWTGLLAAPRLRQLGATSYSYYLTHGFAVKLFKYGVLPFLGSAAETAGVFWASQVAGLVLSIFVANCVFRLVEEPMAKLVVHWRMRTGPEGSLSNLVQVLSEQNAPATREQRQASA